MADNKTADGAVGLGAVLDHEYRYVYSHAPHRDREAALATYVARADALKATASIDVPVAPLPPDATQPADPSWSGRRPARAELDPAALRDIVLSEPELRLGGIAFSGGGIRSASFGLGAQQALGRAGLLSRFDYMSSVSGGGYVLGWLLTWSYRVRGGLPVVERLLAERALGGEPAPLQHLRRYVTYLAPHMNATSADLWALLAAYLRNLGVSLTFALPLVLLPVLLIHLLYAVLRFTVELHGFWWQVFGFSTLLVLAAAEIVAMRLFARDVVPVRGMDSTAATNALLWLHLTLGSTIAGLYLLVPRAALEWPDALKVVLALVGFGAAAWLGERGRGVSPGPRGRDARAARGPVARLLAGLLSAIVFVLFIGIAHALLGASHDGDPLELIWRLPFVALAWSITVAAVEFAHEMVRSKELTDVDREWTVRYTGVLLLGSLLWMVGVGAVLALPAWLLATESVLDKQVVLALLVVACVVAAWRRWSAFFYTLACAALLTLLACRVFVRVGPLDPLESLRAGLVRTAVSVGLLGALVLLIDRFVNINRFSLHSIYRNRLVRAFLGTSRHAVDDARECPAEERAQFRARRPSPYQDVDADDNPRLKWLKLRDDAPEGSGWLPVSLFNASLNSTWLITQPGRPPKAFPFSFSPFFVGSPETGYCRTELYSSGEGGVSLGTAMATSGAALSSRSGRLDNRLVAFMKTMFNLRLGWWLGNPNDPSVRSAAAPRYSMVAFCAELFGTPLRTRDWIHLSDGGHFENLGVFPLLLRGCTDIVAIDASADPARTAPDLATLIRAARAELNVDIVSDGEWRIGAPELGRDGRHCALFRVHYPNGRQGRLLYIKTALYHDGAVAPVDAVSYYREHPAFPHESTMNQFFSEAQFESYRRLGEATLAAILGEHAAGATSLDALFDGARRHLGPAPD